MDPARLAPGYRLDRYELLCPLAYGGMASVWLARFGGRKGFERLVVVKMILPQYSQDPRFQEMFLDEARIASRIEHANVARILDVGEEEENTFIVMEWVDGDSLSKVLRAAEQKKTPIPAGIALRICADAAAGLHAAHTLRDRDGTDLGVVHRDVSPQNILISNAGTTVLIDFGVAKARDRVSQDTSAGQLKGKIRYMAPEQAQGKAMDHRADVWALGAILYEIFGGKPPYDGPNEVATLHKLTSATPPDPLPGTVPSAVRAVIDRALAYDPADRYATALELNLALEAAMVEIGESTSIAVVGHYTAQLLAERKEARRKAVDTALQAARARDTGQSSAAPTAMTIGTPQDWTPAAAPKDDAAKITARLSSSPLYPSPNTSEPPLPVTPSQSPLGLAESPSAASNATLGSASASFDFPPLEEVDDPARKRKYIAAAVLGVSVAAGLVGALLIVLTAMKGREPRDDAAPAAAPPTDTAAETTPAPTAIAPTTAATTTTAAATATVAAPADTAALVPAPVASPTPSVAATAVTTGGATGGSTTTTTTPSQPASTHKPTAPPRKPSGGSQTPTTPIGRPDRGF
ncbi:MAG: serine/threonine protein kinase [Deltaproteobacteria bacterium]|nr:serine/threonine protein kinase [Deltaproteobacteria bacterium]